MIDTRRTLGSEESPVQVGGLQKKSDYEDVGNGRRRAGNGSLAPFTSETAKLASRKNQAMKAERQRAFEEKLSGKLDDVAKLYASIIELANDPEVEISEQQMRAMKLGLTASEQLLNRYLGKPVAHIEAQVTAGISEAMAQELDDWDSE